MTAATTELVQISKKSKEEEKANLAGDPDLARQHKAEKNQSILSFTEMAAAPLILFGAANERVQKVLGKAIDWIKYPQQKEIQAWIQSLFATNQLGDTKLTTDQAKKVTKILSLQSVEEKNASRSITEVEKIMKQRPETVPLDEWLDSKLHDLRMKNIVGTLTTEQVNPSQKSLSSLEQKLSEAGLSPKEAQSVTDQILNKAEASLLEKVASESNTVPVDWLKYVSNKDKQQALLKSAQEVLKELPKQNDKLASLEVMGSLENSLSPLKDLFEKPKLNVVQRVVNLLVTKNTPVEKTPERPARIPIRVAVKGSSLLYEVFALPGKGLRQAVIWPSKAYSSFVQKQNPAESYKTTGLTEIAADLALAGYISQNLWEPAKQKLHNYLYRKEFFDLNEKASYDYLYRQVAEEVGAQLDPDIRVADPLYLSKVLQTFNHFYVDPIKKGQPFVTQDEQSNLSANYDSFFKIFKLDLVWDPELAGLEKLRKSETKLSTLYARRDAPDSRVLPPVDQASYELIFKARVERVSEMMVVPEIISEIKKSGSHDFEAGVQALSDRWKKNGSKSTRLEEALARYKENIKNDVAQKDLIQQWKDKKINILELQYKLQEMISIDFSFDRDQILGLYKKQLWVDESLPADDPNRIVLKGEMTRQEAKMSNLEIFKEKGMSPFTFVVPVTPGGTVDVSKVKVSYKE